MAASLAVAIDLGTTSSRIAVLQGDELTVVPNDHSNTSTPSYVAFADHLRLVGDAAKSQLSGNAVNTVYGLKRVMGFGHGSEHVTSVSKHWPFALAEDAGRMTVQVEYQGETTDLLPEEITAIFVAKLRRTAESHLKRSVCKAVVTVPAMYTYAQRRAVIAAVNAAGMNVLGVINEPTAAALAYIASKGLQPNRTMIVLSFGGGFCEASAVKTSASSIEVLSTASSGRLGGEDIDNVLLDYLIAEVKATHRRDISTNRRALSRLRLALDKAKPALSVGTVVRIEVDSLFDGIHFQTDVSRQKFESLNGDLFRRTVDLIDEAILEGRIHHSQVDDVVLVGGSSRIPKIREFIEKRFSNDAICKFLSTDDAVVHGAAIYAAMMDGQRPAWLEGVKLVDIVTRSLGVATDDDHMEVVVAPKSTIPVNVTTTLSVSTDNKGALRFGVYEGGLAQASRNHALKEEKLSQKDSSGKVKLSVGFELSTNCMLVVTVKDLESNEPRTLAIAQAQDGLDDDDIKRMREKVRLFLEEDRTETCRINAKVRLENFTYRVQDLTSESGQETRKRVALGWNDRAQLQNQCSETLQWIDKNQLADQEEYEYKQEELDDLLRRLGLEIPEQ